MAADPFQWTQLYTEPQSRNVHIASDKEKNFPLEGKYSIGATRSGDFMEADFPLWEALRASSAFPIYYAPHKLSVVSEGSSLLSLFFSSFFLGEECCIERRACFGPLAEARG